MCIFVFLLRYVVILECYLAYISCWDPLLRSEQFSLPVALCCCCCFSTPFNFPADCQSSLTNGQVSSFLPVVSRMGLKSPEITCFSFIMSCGFLSLPHDQADNSDGIYESRVLTDLFSQIKSWIARAVPHKHLGLNTVTSG